MKTDDVLSEIWQIKDEKAAHFNNSVRDMGEALMKSQAGSNRVVVAPPKHDVSQRPQTG